MPVNPIAVRRAVYHLISTKKKISITALQQQQNFSALGFDALDVLDVIVEVEKKFGIIIPDELPLHTADDVVNFICSPALRQAG